MSNQKNGQRTVADIEGFWRSDRWTGVSRPYSAEDVQRLSGTVQIEHTLAKLGAEKLWNLLNTEDHVPALGALTGNQAVQMVQAGLKAIYLSGWQVAADANLAGEMYPDLSLYPSDSVPAVVRRINNAFKRADEIRHAEGKDDIDWFAPIIADGEAGFGGALNTFELTKAMIDAGAAAVHLEDQLASAKKCGHMGGKVVIPTSEFVHKLIAARLASDVLGVPTVIIARTDALGASFLANDIDPRDQPFVKGDRTPEGFVAFKAGLDAAIARGLAYAPYADMIWCETSKPDMDEARQFAEGIHAQYPGKLLAYNCSPSFNWNLHLTPDEIAEFQRELGKMGYKFQFVTLAGWHALNYGTFNLARGYKEHGMSAYAEMQRQEFASESDGYEATRHQRFVGAGYFDKIGEIATGTSALGALSGSTEEAQFEMASPRKNGKKGVDQKKMVR